MTTAPMFQKATRSAVRLKIGLQGPSGSGKTLGALALAQQMAGAGRFAVIDTENGSASLYADRFDFDTLNLEPPYTSKAYQDAIDAAVAAGYKVIVVDSLSHQWAGKGGILSRKEEMDTRGGNSFTNWAVFTKEHEAFKAHLLNADAHIVATLRTKQEYVMEENSKGKQMPKKVGTAPVQREGMEYELSVVFELQMDHKASTSKDRTGLFDGQLTDLTDRTVAKRLGEWLASAAPATSKGTPAVREAEQVPARAPGEEMTLADALTVTVSDNPAAFKGKGADLLDSYSTEHLAQLRTWFEEKLLEGHRDDFALRVEAATLILDAREAEQGKLELASTSAPSEPVADVLPEPTPEVTRRVHQKRGTGMDQNLYVPASELTPDDPGLAPF